MSTQDVHLVLSASYAGHLERMLTTNRNQHNFAGLEAKVADDLIAEINSQLARGGTAPEPTETSDAPTAKKRAPRRKAPSKTDAVAKDVASKMAKSAKAATESHS